MALRDDLMEVLDICIDRLNAGEDVERILADFPELANRLRPMLEAGRLFPRVRYAPPIVEQAREAVQPSVNRAVEQTFGSGWPTVLIPLLVILLVGIGLTGVLVFGGGGGLFAAPTETPTLTATSTDTPTASVTPSLTATETVTSTPTATASQTASLTATVTSSATATATASPMLPIATAQVRQVIVIEGPVEEIDGREIEIYNRRIVLDDDDPRRRVIEVGDVIRIEGELQDDTSIRVITLVFVDIVVLVRGGDVWRGDDCRNPPPGWAQSQAGEWIRRCQASGGGSGGGSGGSSGDDDDDDDDDDD
jgi:hypothetical protein